MQFLTEKYLGKFDHYILLIDDYSIKAGLKWSKKFTNLNII